VSGSASSSTRSVRGRSGAGGQLAVAEAHVARRAAPEAGERGLQPERLLDEPRAGRRVVADPGEQRRIAGDQAHDRGEMVDRRLRAGDENLAAQPGRFARRDGSGGDRAVQAGEQAVGRQVVGRAGQHRGEPAQQRELGVQPDSQRLLRVAVRVARARRRGDRGEHVAVGGGQPEQRRDHAQRQLGGERRDEVDGRPRQHAWDEVGRVRLDDRSEPPDACSRQERHEHAAQPGVVGRVEREQRLQRDAEQVRQLRLLGGQLRQPAVVGGRERPVDRVRRPRHRVPQHLLGQRVVGDGPAPEPGQVHHGASRAPGVVQGPGSPQHVRIEIAEPRGSRHCAESMKHSSART
jgi:hypothetical protein